MCALFAVPASAEPMDIMLNGEMVQIDAELVSDRTMITADSLEMLGMSVCQEGGFWDITKGEKSFYYDDVKKAVSGTNGEVQTDVMPIITADRASFPLRAVAECLGVSVGWDKYENTVVLIDLDKYFGELRETSPALYEFLSLKMRQPEKGRGNSDITVDVKIPDDYGDSVAFKLKVVSGEEISQKLSKSNIKLEELLISSREFDFALNDVTIDGLYDAETMTIYLKTNAVQKIYEVLPTEYKTKFAGIAQLFSGAAWYRVSFDDYMEFVQEMTGVYADDTYTSQMSEMLERLYADGIELGDVLGKYAVNDVLIDDVYAFEYMDEMFNMLSEFAEAEFFTVETVDEMNKKLKVSITVDSIVKYASMHANRNGYIPTEEDVEEYRSILAERLGDSAVVGEILLSDGVPTEEKLTVNIHSGDGMMKIDVNSSFDTTAEIGEIALPPETVDLMMLIKTLMQYAEVV